MNASAQNKSGGKKKRKNKQRKRGTTRTSELLGALAALRKQ